MVLKMPGLYIRGPRCDSVRGNSSAWVLPGAHDALNILVKIQNTITSAGFSLHTSDMPEMKSEGTLLQAGYDYGPSEMLGCFLKLNV